MIAIPAFKDKCVVVVGLGRTGHSAIRALQASGAKIIAWDDHEHNRAPALAQGITLQSPDEINWGQVTALILSPGIPHQHPHPHPSASYARQLHIPIICDIDLLAQAVPQARYIGITGTNGKSTTTALIGHLMKAIQVPNQVGGNIGIPVLELSELGEDGRYILELSSYQLERAPHLSIDTAVWLNITPDHLERHGDLQGYVEAKANIFRPEGEAQNIAIGIDDTESHNIYETLKQDEAKVVVPVSVTRANPKGVFVRDGILTDTFFGKGEILDLKTLPSLKGQHNWQNIALAYAALTLENLAFDIEALRAFKGLAHRQELCGQKGAIQFVNDSKATNIDSTLKALPSYENIYLILGGQPKENMLDGIETYKHHIKSTYLIGQAAPAFAEILQQLDIPYKHCRELKAAVTQAINDAEASPLNPKTILLSPACASWDQFKDFEHRGQQFKDFVSALIAEPTAPATHPPARKLG
jgi:UDP-N-acetylmuramoylalanine--D-glutamate ligase